MLICASCGQENPDGARFCNACAARSPPRRRARRAEALDDLATVLDAAGRRGDAVVALHEALALYGQKGIVLLARRARAQLAALQAA